MPVSGLTKLEAVNEIISLVQLPINTFNVKTANVLAAEHDLDIATRRSQQSGFEYNSERQVVLSPNSDNQIVIESNVISVDSSNINENYVILNSKLYNKDKKTFTFTSDVKVDLIKYYEFEELPELLKWYVMYTAKYNFGVQRKKALDQQDILKQEVYDSKAAWFNANTAVSDTTITNNPHSNSIGNPASLIVNRNQWMI